MEFGIYIHIPFCQTRCNYCHFVTRPMRSATAEEYCRAVVRELAAYANAAGKRPAIDSIFFGGGTPSAVPCENVARILECCRTNFEVSPESEITLEANPDTLTAQKADCYRRIGINRFSLGAQSFDDAELISIGRDHTASQISEAVAFLRAAGIENISLDLMLGLPAQDESRWRTNLDQIERLQPSHISVYMLDLHDNSPLFYAVAKKRVQLPDDDLVADLYLLTLERLSSFGFEQYEISNFARPGGRSRHNLKYWRREPVIGFGVSSHSFDRVERWANYSRIAEYLRSVEERGSAVEWRRPLQAAECMEEALFLGLRLNEGVDWEMLRPGLEEPTALAVEAVFRKMSDRGLLSWIDSTVRLTPKGMLMSNEVFSEFV